MANPALKALRDYEQQRKRGVTQYSFDPEALGIPHADYWVERRRQEVRQAAAERS
jgi:alanine or glycine:cation symporter, AGCS family